MGTNIENRPSGVSPQQPIEGGGSQPPAIDSFFETLLKSLEELTGSSGTGATSEIIGTQSPKDLIVGGFADGGSSLYSNDLGDPNLLGPDADLITNFNNSLAKLMAEANTSEGILPCGTNSWFTPSGAFTLFLILTTMSTIMAKMARENALVDIALTNIQMSMAKEISSLVLSQGEVAAQKLEADALKSQIEGIVALGQIAMSVITIAYSEGAVANKKAEFVETKKLELLSKPVTQAKDPVLHKLQTDFNNTPDADKMAFVKNLNTTNPAGHQHLDRLAQPSASEMVQIRSTVANTQVAVFKDVYGGLFTAIKSFMSARQDLIKADLEREQAMMDSTRTLIDKLFDIISKTERKVDSDTEGIRKVLQDMLSKLGEIIKLAGKFWSGQA